MIYRIVGPDEFDMEKGFISMDSPMAKALLKKGVDDEVEVPIPAGKAIYYVLEVSYQPDLHPG
jgi:transcription elongation factor GreB